MTSGSSLGQWRLGRFWYYSDRKSPCPLGGGLTSVSTSTTVKLEFEDQHMKPAFRVECLLFNSPFGLAMVLLGREPEFEVEAWLEFMILLELGCSVLGENRWSGYGLHRWRTAGQLRYEWAPPQVTQLCSTAFTGAGAETGDVCLSRSRALTISFNSATSGDTRSGSARTHLSTMALLRSDELCDLPHYDAESISLVKLRESMMWTCLEKIFESIPSFTKRFIKSLFEIGNFVPKICRFRSEHEQLRPHIPRGRLEPFA
ncbi:hypothetical protein Tco_1042058 [Tanacetum coccineum]|uniref:Uncharacterized protein n=1 Tax=Tanacetum coccineum TaxID=301880 RepID=A0ABQ5GIT3_9ASTR